VQLICCTLYLVLCSLGALNMLACVPARRLGGKRQQQAGSQLYVSSMSATGALQSSCVPEVDEVFVWLFCESRTLTAAVIVTSTGTAAVAPQALQASYVVCVTLFTVGDDVTWRHHHQATSVLHNRWQADCSPLWQ
jgi:hypothetical protein